MSRRSPITGWLLTIWRAESARKLLKWVWWTTTLRRILSGNLPHTLRSLNAIEKLIGPNVFLLATHFFNKYGEGDQAEAFVAWHQDVTFWGLEPPMAITAWYAVDDSDEENGCMQVIPGTHVSGVVEHGKAEQSGNLLSINQEVHVSPEQSASAVDLPLDAGQVSIHDGTLIHGSLPNRSNRRRCGLTLRYVPTWVRQAEANSFGGRWKPVLVRGQDERRTSASGRPAGSEGTGVTG